MSPFAWQSNKVILFYFTKNSVSEIWFGIGIQRSLNFAINGNWPVSKNSQMMTRGQLWPPDLHLAYLPFVNTEMIDKKICISIGQKLHLFQDRLWSYHNDQKLPQRNTLPGSRLKRSEVPHQILSLLLIKLFYLYKAIFKEVWLYCGPGPDKAILLFVVAFEVGKMKTQRGFWEEK